MGERTQGQNIRSISDILQSLDDSEGRIDAPPISREEVHYYLRYASIGKTLIGDRIECHWHWEGDEFYEYSYWTTGCGEAHYFEEGSTGVHENHYQFCPYCGGKIVVEKKEEE